MCGRPDHACSPHRIAPHFSLLRSSVEDVFARRARMYSFCALSIDIDRFIVLHKPLEDFQRKRKEFFFAVPHQDAIPLPRLNDGPDFSSRERVCVITCPLVSLVVLRGLKSCVAGLRGIRISAIPFRRHKTRNVLGEKKTFFLTSPQDSDESSAFISVTRKIFGVLYSEFFFGAHYFHLTREKTFRIEPTSRFACRKRTGDQAGTRWRKRGKKNEAPGAP